tara:strand:+ start:2558 stop:3907 length:1350 start_codon:yes stop_codon:yes gene_type:complete
MKLIKVLIANRGEIALRVIRACKELGLKTVAVHSTADSQSQHVRSADEAVCVGPPAARESYLNMANIISAAEITGADAIHPGYGFLSENADFVEVLTDCGINFVGPLAESITKMGDKSRARQTMIEVGVPVVPGSDGLIHSVEEGLEIAKKCGFPVMVKASAGGGGKGMRVIASERDFRDQYDMARAEALNAFGNGDLYVEKFVEEPRHVEVQILADHHGNVIHLGERNCSIQRRHQKLLEEAPSPAISSDLRDRICEAGVLAAKAIGYRNAGTVEFLVDKHENFYFMEMNTRLQVEHPVTEMITGVDLVREQLLIAQGEKLSYSQDEINFNGHSIEFRINAEDPNRDFAPSPGEVSRLTYPGGYGVRIDSMISAGDSILPYYDSMVAKLIVWGKDRKDAIARGQRALREFEIEGIESTVDVHDQIISTDTFKKGYFTTGFLDREFLKE